MSRDGEASAGGERFDSGPGPRGLSAPIRAEVSASFAVLQGPLRLRLRTGGVLFMYSVKIGIPKP